MTERKLATIQVVAQVRPIKDADRIEAVRIKGWWVVVKKAEYVVGDKVVYCEIDSWVPTALAPFLSGNNTPKMFNDIAGERLRTIRLRGQVSQGLILPIGTLAGEKEGSDVTEVLGITKWEKPIPANLQGLMKGNFPTFIPRTKLERIQNMPHVLAPHEAGTVEVTEKLDGSSMTVYHRDGVVGVCSRSVDLKLDQEGNALVDMFNTFTERQMTWLKTTNVALQGELVDGAVQGNPYGIDGCVYFVFNIFDIDTYEYLSPQVALATAKRLGFDYVPIVTMKTLPVTRKEYLVAAEGRSMLGDTQREGLIFKPVNGTPFKVISNQWLLKPDR